MGDYNVQIISARVKTEMSLEEFTKEVESRLCRHDSAYHATAPFINIVSERFDRSITVSAIIQAKYNHGIEEFLQWLEPMVVQGIGKDEAWSINFSEYGREPAIRYLDAPSDD